MKKHQRSNASRCIPSTEIAMIFIEELSRSAPDVPELAQAAGMLRAKQFVRAYHLLSSLHPRVYDAGATFIVAQAKAALSKVVFPGLDPESAAIQRWFQAEHRCKRTNQKLRAWRKRFLLGTGGARYVNWVTKAQGFIRAVLGDEPPVKDIVGMCRHGPGSSVGVSGDATHYIKKTVSQQWTVSPTAAPYAVAGLRRDAAIWEQVGLTREGLLCYDHEEFADRVAKRMELISHDETLMVPKNAKTHRFICKQPLLNCFVQLGVGDWMMERLRRAPFHCDLRDQTRNQRLAFHGSRGGYNTWATIDMEMASDTISFETVKLLLPPAWFRFLNSIRTPSYKMTGGAKDGQILSYEKFSAMGNGFTFPLETLLFMACSHAVNNASPSDFSVYGDDIIVRQCDALVLIEFMSFLGFRVNDEKSFIFGNFKESCGSDYFDGCNIRPAYVKGESVYPEQLIGLYNRLKRNGYIRFHNLEDRLLKLWGRFGFKHIPWSTTQVDNLGFMTDDPTEEGPYHHGWQRRRHYHLVLTPIYDVDAAADSSFLQLSAVLAGAAETDDLIAFAYRRRTKRRVRLEPAEEHIPSAIWSDTRSEAPR